MLSKFFLQVDNEEADEVLLKYSVLSSSFTFLLFNASRDVNITFHAIKVVSHESRMPKLLRFLPSEITLFMLNALDSYTPNERASLEPFLETHIQVLMLAAKSKEDASTAISMLLAKKQDIEEGYIYTGPFKP